MVLCKDCDRYFCVERKGKKWHLCDMDCRVDVIDNTYDCECDWYEPVDRNDSENGSNKA